MPGTITGLLVFIAMLIPGFIHYSWRRRLVPMSSDSPLLETAKLVTVSLITNVVAIGVFALGRVIWPEGLLDPQEFLLGPGAFFANNPGETLLTGVGILVIACGLALGIAEQPGPLKQAAEWFAPTILDTSAWYEAFEELNDVDRDKYVHAGCTLRDGGFLSGLLAWYSTDTDEGEARDLALAPPFYRQAHGTEADMTGVSRVVLSARDIIAMEVSLVDEGWANEQDAQSTAGMAPGSE